MKREDGGVASGERGLIGATGNQLQTSSRDAAVAATIRELMAAGFVSQHALAKELNRRKIPTTTMKGRWHRTTVQRLLFRLGLAGNGNNGLAIMRIADARAEAVGPTIHELRKAGFVTIKAIVRELNERRIPTARGGKWHKTTVIRLLERLNRLDRPSNIKHTR